jgi:hypothetical protein
MRHEQPHGDNTGLTTNELVCALVSRFDAPNSLFSLLALQLEMSHALPIHNQLCMAATLRDCADLIEERVCSNGADP